jgi:hypothetical protein
MKDSITHSIDKSSEYLSPGILSFYLWSTSRVTAQYVAKIAAQAPVLLAAAVESLLGHL